MTVERCIDCDGTGIYPSGARCKSCEGTGKVGPGDGQPMTLTSNQCGKCSAPAVGAVLKDPFGKSDVMEPRCGDHMPRLRDPADVAEIERLTREAQAPKFAFDSNFVAMLRDPPNAEMAHTLCEQAAAEIERLRAALMRYMATTLSAAPAQPVEMRPSEEAAITRAFAHSPRRIEVQPEGAASKLRISDSQLAGAIAYLQDVRLNPVGLSTRESVLLLALWELRERRELPTPVETSGAGWRPIETAPKDGTRVHLGFAGLQNFDVIGHWEANFQHWAHGSLPQDKFYGRPNPTHWKPLPDAPRQVKATERQP